MKYLKYILILLLILISIFLIDMKTTRHYFLSKITTEIDFGGNYEEDDEIQYTIQKIDSTEYKVRIKNKSWHPHYLTGYRHDEIFYQLNESDLFNLASRKRIKYKNDTLNFHYGFDCGTGLGIFSINPKENFEDTRSLGALTNHFNLTNYVFKIDSIYYSRINNKPLLRIDKLGELHWINENKKHLKGSSIKIQFALPYYSVLNGEAKVAYSNELTLNYIDLLEKRILR